MASKPGSPGEVRTASPRQWVGLAVVYLSIPLVLLSCGGDFGWWQAWLYSLLFVAIGLGGRIWAERRHPGLLAERQDVEKARGSKSWDKVLAPLMALSVSFPLVIVAGLDHRYGGSPAFPPWLDLLGLILVALGYGFAAWAVAENRFFFSTVRIEKERGHVVCDSGPYRIVRHPGYAGNIPPLLGISLALHFAGPGLGVGADPGGRGADRHGDQNRAGRPGPAGRVAGLSRVRAARALPLDSGNLLSGSFLARRG